MDVREKLVAWLCEAMILFDKRKDEKDINPFEVFADHLIANGVTVQEKKRFLLKENGDLIPLDQEWISVKDRLPEQTDPATAVLGITERGRCHIVYYFKGVTSEEFTGFYDLCAKRKITHWMPLPKPPKGE